VPIGTAVHERTFSLCESMNYREWSGYYAVSAYEAHHEHEYNAIRNAAALIDISPLFKYRVTGSDATRLVDRIVTRDLTKVAPGSVIYTDHSHSYNRLAEAGFIHYPTNISDSPDPAHVAMPRVHRVSSLLKRWLLGTHHGGISARQLDFYLDEFTFRFNRRSSRHRGLLFHRLLEQATHIDHVPFTHLVGGRA